MLKYDSCEVVLQEIPNEISLCFTITGCQLACDGCHSEHLWNPENGTELSPELFLKIISKYQFVVTCVLFMGGEWDDLELISLIKIARQKKLKTALYTGLNEKQMQKKHPELLLNLDFIKTGKWISKLGGLNNSYTNQILRDLRSGEIINHYFIR